MRKALFIMAAALMTMTQCKKQETMPVTPADTMKMTITAGPGRTDINTETGAITWSAGDKLYVSDGTSWLGSLTLVGEGGSAQGTFTGSITGLDDEGTPCHFFYLGKGNVTTELTGIDAVSISFAAQDGTLRGENGAMKYHIGYGTTNVTVKSGEYQGYVVMNTKIAIAHINFTMNDAPHTGAVTMGMGCADVRNTMTVSPDGTFSGSGNGGIVIGKGDGTTSEKYVTLIPTTGTGVLNVSFTGYATGSMTFAKGIHENKFYGMKDAIAVTLTPNPKFSVDENNTTVEFAPGNLYWDGGSWKFEANQWDFRHYNGITNDAAVIGGESMTTPAGTVGSFYWSKTASFAYASSYSDSGASTSDVFFTNSTETTANSEFHVNGESGTNTWRTLSKAEWDYLLGTGAAGTSSRTNASSLRALKELDGHKGLVILPDGTGASIMNSITSTADLASYGAVFLPAAGYRYNGGESGIIVQHCNVHGHYWSSINDGSTNYAYNMAFSFSDSSNAPSTVVQGRSFGFTVRLVR